MRLGGRGAHMGFAWGAHELGVTGCDMGCRTLRCYVNSGVGHWMSDGADPGRLVRDPGATLWAKEGGPKGDRH